MYGLDVAILLTYGSHDERHVDFRGLTVVNETPRDRGVTEATCMRTEDQTKRSHLEKEVMT